MALRKPLFMSTEGFSEEMAAADSLQLGGLSMGGDIAMGTYKITGMGDPTAGQDAATKAYVDAVAQSLVVKDNVHAMSSTNVVTLSGAPVTIDGTSVAIGERVLLTGQTNIPFAGTGDSLTNAAGTTTLVDAAGTFTASCVGESIVVSGSTNPGNDGTFTIASYIDATSVTYVNASGVTETSSFTYTGVAGIDNGIWVVQAGAWTRPMDFASGLNVAGAFTFVQQGTNYADTGWICTNDNPSDVVNTSPLTFVQFSAAGQILAGNGLQKVGNTVSVKKGDGIEVTSNDNATNIDLALNPGLTLSGTSPNKKLAALVAANQGLQIDGANGLALLLNGTTLQVGVSGVSVKGVPNLFEIGGTATSQTPGTGQVTAANLNSLTAGASSNADSLHTHALPSVPYAGRVEFSQAVAEAVAAGDPVYQSATNDRVGKGDAANDSKSRVFGVARTGQNTVGDAAPIVYVGPCPGVLSGATAGDAYYLQSGGGIGTSLPGAGRRVIRVGVAKNATDLHVFILDYGKKAA